MRIGRTNALQCVLLLAPAILGAFANAQTPSAKDSSLPADPLLKGFFNPPKSARPQVWWHWMNGNVTAEGVDFSLAVAPTSGSIIAGFYESINLSLTPLGGFNSAVSITCTTTAPGSECTPGSSTAPPYGDNDYSRQDHDNLTVCGDRV